MWGAAGLLDALGACGGEEPVRKLMIHSLAVSDSSASEVGLLVGCMYKRPCRALDSGVKLCGAP